MLERVTGCIYAGTVVKSTLNFLDKTLIPQEFLAAIWKKYTLPKDRPST